MLCYKKLTCLNFTNVLIGHPHFFQGVVKFTWRMNWEKWWWVKRSGTKSLNKLKKISDKIQLNGDAKSCFYKLFIHFQKSLISSSKLSTMAFRFVYKVGWFYPLKTFGSYSIYQRWNPITSNQKFYAGRVR